MSERIETRIRPADTFYEESLLLFERKFHEFMMPAYLDAMEQNLSWDDELLLVERDPLSVRFERAANGEYFLHDEEDEQEHSILLAQDETKYKGPQRYIYSKDRQRRTPRPRILTRTKSVLVQNLYLGNTENSLMAIRLVQHQQTGWCFQERRLKRTPGGRLHPYWSHAKSATAEQFDLFASLLERPEDYNGGDDDTPTLAPTPDSPFALSR